MPETPNVKRVGYSSLIWNSRACRYVDERTKRFLSPERVRATVDADIASRGERMQRLAQRVASGEINPTEFAIALRKETRAAHLAHAAAGKGGFHQMDAATYGKVGGLLRYHFGRVDVFAADIRNGRYGEPPDVEQIKARVSLYSEAARGTFEDVRRDEEMKAGFAWEENELDDSVIEHCIPTGKAESCPQQTAKGRVPVGTLLLPGSRACGPRCRCRLRRYKSAA